MPSKKRNKYRSKFEARVARALSSRCIPILYESDVLEFEQPAVIRKYAPDFRIGDRRFIEVKGRWTASDRKKMLWVIESNPGIEIKMLFMRDNALSKRSRTTYTEWCRKHGIDCAVWPDVPWGEWCDRSS